MQFKTYERLKIKRSELFATFFLAVVREDANQKLEDKVDDFNSTEDGEAWEILGCFLNTLDWNDLQFFMVME